MAAPKGNRFGAKPRLWENALKRALARAGGSVDNGLNLIADKVVEAAKNGDQAAWREISDRLDGKAMQAIEMTQDVAITRAEQVTDDELASIATASGAGTSETPESPEGPSSVH